MALPDDDRQALLDEMEAADANMDSQLDFEEFLVFFNSILKVSSTCKSCLLVYTLLFLAAILERSVASSILSSNKRTFL